MIGIKVYPGFVLQAGAVPNDGEFLNIFKNVRDSTRAQYVNFSVHDYSGSSREMKQYLTYPMDWISHYLKNSFQEIDPLLTLDYRRVAYVDWSDMWCTNDELRFFSSSIDHGIGNNGVSLVVHLGQNKFGVTSLIFEQKHESWKVFRDQNLELMRQQAEYVSEHYKRLFTQMPVNHYNLTKRELECLHLVAVGETDTRISALMGIGRWTVNSHVKSSKFKLGVTNRSAAVAKALTLGLLNLKSEFNN